MQGTAAIVTGSTSGIGLGIAHRLAAAGADIMLNGFGDADEIEAMRQAIEREHDVRCVYSPADMTRPDEIDAMVAAAAESFGKVDLLVNNAGIQYTAKVQDFPREKWDAIIAINLSAAFHGARAVLPQMLERGRGRIINIASAHGLVASPEKAGYVAAKHGIVGLTKVIALETAGTDVTCNAICPGWVLTPLVKAQIEDRAKQQDTSVKEEERKLLEEKQPSGNFVTPEQIGDFAVFLCSPAADEIRGQALAMDGGWTAQ